MNDLTAPIELAASKLLGWRYPARPTVPVFGPTQPRGFPIRAARNDAERVINCSTLTAWLLFEVFADAGWTLQDYGDLQVWADRLPVLDSPIRAVERRGIGRRGEAVNQAGWYLVQGWWRLTPPGGHALLAQFCGDRVRVLESTSLELRGPRWRWTTEGELRARFSAGLYIARLDGGGHGR